MNDSIENNSRPTLSHALDKHRIEHSDVSTKNIPRLDLNALENSASAEPLRVMEMKHEEQKKVRINPVALHRIQTLKVKKGKRRKRLRSKGMTTSIILDDGRRKIVNLSSKDAVKARWERIKRCKSIDGRKLESKYMLNTDSTEYTRKNSEEFSKDIEEKWVREKEKLVAKDSMKIFKTKLVSYGKNTQDLNHEEIAQGSTDEKKPRPKIDCLLFLPNSQFIQYWNIIVILLLLFTAYVMPYQIAFLEGLDTADWFVTNIIVDCLFISDILINLNTAIVVNGVLVISRKEIFLDYLKGWLILDIISSIPMDLLEILIFGQNTAFNMRTLRLARLPRLYRLIRITRFLKLSKIFRRSAAFSDIEEYFEINTGFGRLLVFILSVLTCVHIVGCFWYYFAKIEELNPSTWVFRKDFQDKDIGSTYLFSIYWAIQTLLTVGYGDIPAVTTCIFKYYFKNS